MWVERTNMKSFAINEVPAEIVGRASCGYPEIDWIMGCSEDASGVSWGVPQGKITMVAGESGVGKSRWSIAMACSLANNGMRVLYIQNEVNLGTFAGWVQGRVSKPENFRVANGRDLSDLVDTIQELRPQIVFLDSINQMNEFGSGSKTKISVILEGDDKTLGLRDLCNNIGIHLFFISHLNQNGSVKGSTTLKHLIDIVLKIVHAGAANYFLVKIGDKHRYGRTGDSYKSLWMHTDKGVDCQSNHRLEDGRWVSTHPGEKLIEYKQKIPVVKKRSTWRRFVDWSYDQCASAGF